MKCYVAGFFLVCLFLHCWNRALQKNDETLKMSHVYTHTSKNWFVSLLMEIGHVWFLRLYTTFMNVALV